MLHAVAEAKTKPGAVVWVRLMCRPQRSRVPGCHGTRCEGKTEGGVTAGPLTWSFLTKPYGHTDEGGRKHQAFSEMSFVRMLTAGLDPAGNKLAVAMPKYAMSQEDMGKNLGSSTSCRV